MLFSFSGQQSVEYVDCSLPAELQANVTQAMNEATEKERQYAA